MTALSFENNNTGSTKLQYDDTSVNDYVITLPHKTCELAPLASPAFTGTPTVNGTNISAYGQNYIINGGFDRWDYATSQTTGGYSSANRWISYWDGTGGTVTMSQQAFVAGELGANTPKYFLRRNMSVASTGGVDGNALITKLEDVRKFASKTMTISFWAKCVGTPFTLVCNAGQNFGTGGSPSASVVTSVASQLLTTGWVKYSFTFTLPSILGKTLGTTDTTSHLQLSFNQPMNTISLLDIAQVQLEEGSVATPWTPYEGEFGGEVQACQRYFTVFNAAFDGYVAAGGRGSDTVVLPNMRIIPTVTLITDATFGANSNSGGESKVINGLSAFIVRSGIAAGQLIWSGTYTASAEL